MAGIALALVVPGSASAINIIGQLGGAEAVGDEWITNELDVEISGDNLRLLGSGGWSGGSQAIANCQFILAVNAIVINVAAVDSLGLIGDEDIVEVPAGGDNGPRIESIGNGIGDTVTTHNGTATCEQNFGHVQVVHAEAPGWGEAAPLAGQAADLADSLGGAAPASALELNAIIQLGVAGAGLQDVIHNEAEIDIHGGAGNAVANCQVVVGWNLLAINAAVVQQGAEIQDSDSRTGVEDPTNGDVNLPIGVAGMSHEHHETTVVHEGGTAHCKQTVDGITLVVGTPDSIGRQS